MKKTVLSVIFLIFAIQTAFCVSANGGMNINDTAKDITDNDFYDTVKEFSMLTDFGINEETLPDEKITGEFANNALLKLSGSNPLLENGEVTNEEIFVSICRIFGIEKKEKPYSTIKNFNDFGFISPENKGYYESVFSEKKIDTKYLNPKKSADYKSFFMTLSLFEKEIFSKNGFDVFSDIVIENSVFDNTRTVKTAGGYEFKIPMNNDVPNLGYEALRGTKCTFFVKDKTLLCLKGTERTKTGGTVKVNGIYKAKLFLFDQNTGKFILRNLCRYQSGNFTLTNASYSDFDSYGNFITVLNFQKCDRNLLNGSYIDREIIFITALDGDKEKIVYVYLN